MNERGAAEGSENVIVGDKSEDCPASPKNDDPSNPKKPKIINTTDNSSDSVITEDTITLADKNGNCPDDIQIQLLKDSDTSKENETNEECHDVAKHTTIENNQGGGGTADGSGDTADGSGDTADGSGDTADGSGDIADTLFIPDEGNSFKELEVQEIPETKLEQHLAQCVIPCGSGDATTDSLRSILKKGSDMSRSKCVTFAENLNCSIDTKFRDLFVTFNWNGVQHHTVDEIIREYQAACTKTHAIPLDAISDQLHEIHSNTDYSAVLNLTNVRITGDIINMLEVVFQMANFRTLYINIAQLESDICHDIFNMIDYYDPVLELVLSGQRDDLSMWQSFADAAANNHSLSSVSFREITIEDQALRIIFDGINSNQNIKIVRFDGCELNRAPTFMLANHLKTNYFLEELHLCFADLYFKEADILGKFLTVNTSLRVLNLSNNKIGDRGFDALTKGLLEQSQKGEGVVVLMLANNRLTKKCAGSLETVISQCLLIHSINVGMNNLTDSVINEIKPALESSSSLQAFCLQSILLTCSGLHNLVEACQKNKSLRHLNLRGNKAVQPEALNELADAIHRTTLVQIDMDDTNRYCSNPQQYIEVVNQIRRTVAVNKLVWEDNGLDQYRAWGREYSLNCEPEFVPQPRGRSTRSRTSTTQSRSRFQVVTVPETTTVAPLSPTHRFTVVSVAPASTVVVANTGTIPKNAESSSELGLPQESPAIENVNIETVNVFPQDEGSSETQTCKVEAESISVNTDIPFVTVSSESAFKPVEQQKDAESSEPDLGNLIGNSNNTIAHNRNDCIDGDPPQTID